MNVVCVLLPLPRTPTLSRVHPHGPLSRREHFGEVNEGRTRQVTDEVVIPVIKVWGYARGSTHGLQKRSCPP